MPASGGRLIQHPQWEYARRLSAVSSPPTSRHHSAPIFVCQGGCAMRQPSSRPATSRKRAPHTHRHCPQWTIVESMLIHMLTPEQIAAADAADLAHASRAPRRSRPPQKCTVGCGHCANGTPTPSLRLGGRWWERPSTPPPARRAASGPGRRASAQSHERPVGGKTSGPETLAPEEISISSRYFLRSDCRLSLYELQRDLTPGLMGYASNLATSLECRVDTCLSAD